MSAEGAKPESNRSNENIATDLGYVCAEGMLAYWSVIVTLNLFSVYVKLMSHTKSVAFQERALFRHHIYRLPTSAKI